MADIHRRSLTRSNLGILQSAKYSDYTVRCGSQDFKIHRAIVCPRSEFFAAACDGKFREKELINLDFDDPPTIYRMLSYLYTLEYDDDGPPASAKHYMANETKAATSQALTTTNTPLSLEDLSRHAKMMNNVVVYAIAQKYGINELKELATMKFHGLLWLKAPDYAFPDIIGAVYETSSIPDQNLRLVAAKYCANHITQILADDHLRSIIEEYGELMLDVLRAVNVDSARNAKLQQRFHKQLIDLGEKLVQMMDITSGIGFAAKCDNAVAELLQALEKTYDDHKIDDE